MPHGQGSGFMRSRGNRRGRGQTRGGVVNRGRGEYQGQSRNYLQNGHQGGIQKQGGYLGRGGNQMRGGRGGNPIRGGQTRGRSYGMTRVGDSNNSFRFNLQNFMKVVKNNTTETNDIMLISNTLYGGNYGFKDRFECEPAQKKTNVQTFEGVLYFGDQFITRHVDVNKKRIKSGCYSKAVGILSTFTVDQILNLKDTGNGEPVIKQEADTSQVTKPVAESTIQLFNKLKDTLSSQLGLELHVISRLEQAGAMVKSPLLYVEGSAKDPEDKKPIFEGSLYFDDVHVAIARNINKKLTKLSCYEMAFDHLLKFDSHTLSQGLTEEQLSSIITGDVGILTKFYGENLDVHQLRLFMEELAKPENKPFSAHFDILALEELKTSPSLLFRKPPGKKTDQVICELYLCNILISSGQGATHLAAKRSAYEYAEMFFNMSTPESILRENRRLTSEDKKAPDVIEYCVVSVNTRAQSNILKLKSSTWTNFPDECQNLSVKDLVIMEQERWNTDRIRTQAFGILSLSCNTNGLLLEWDFERLSNNVFECVILIQGEKLATVRTAATNKNAAKSIAAAHILFNLYETCPVVEMLTCDPNPRVITLDEVKAEGERLKSSGLYVEDLQYKGKDQEDEVGGNPPLQTTKPIPDKYQVFAFKSIVNAFFLGGNLRDIQLEANFPHDIISFSKLLADKFIHYRNHEDFSTIHKNYHPKKLFELLMKENGSSGRYKLVPQNQVPTQSDLKIEMASSQRVLNAALQQKKVSELKKASSNQSNPQKRKMAPPANNFGPSSQKKQRGVQHNFGLKRPGFLQTKRGGIQSGGVQRPQQNFINQQQRVQQENFQSNQQYFQNQPTTFLPKSSLRSRGNSTPKRPGLQKTRDQPQRGRAGGIRPPAFLNHKKLLNDYLAKSEPNEIYGDETYDHQNSFVQQPHENYYDFTSDCPTLTPMRVTPVGSVTRGGSRGRGGVVRGQTILIQNRGPGYEEALYGEGYGYNKAFEGDYYNDSFTTGSGGIIQSFDYGHQSVSGFEEPMMY
ncbi:hypothetical protein LOTGIDRAFT_231828 [Lottia gigantea]|uniref:DRBM domain-containing protein n=1 Tax=Lottia gigantea TaxID=225164 RepID=V4AMT7_LOTGI|nr:hypothetical protein LOTGIDRAFT_231828 [Lottia gigantea]ESO96085.1 hypothetical protein LOTGIDRAFT_231828 [Lottia gigantea]